MQTKTIWIAVVGIALTAEAALAQSSSLQLYGKLYPFVSFEKGSGASSAGATLSPITNAAADGGNAIASTAGLVAGNSRVGLRGAENLGGGLKAIWQIESLAAIDSGQGQIGGRDSFVGLEGGFGSFRLGHMDTIFKNYGDTLRFLGVSSGTWVSTSDVLRKIGFGTSSASSFHLRRTNSALYETPEVGGLVFGIQGSSSEAKTSTRDPRVLSLGIKFDAGPLYIAIAHEIHKDLFGGSQNAPLARRNTNDPTVNSTDKATQATIEYRVGRQHRFELDYIRKQYRETARVSGRFREYANDAVLMAMENRWGERWRTAFSYVWSQRGSCELVGTACSTDGLEASKITLGAAYYFSRRTYAFGAVGRVTNGHSARFNSADFGSPAPGEDITQAALGLAHSF